MAQAQASALSMVGSICRTRDGVRYVWSRQKGLGHFLHRLLDGHIIKHPERVDPKSHATWLPDNFWYMVRFKTTWKNFWP